MTDADHPREEPDDRDDLYRLRRLLISVMVTFALGIGYVLGVLAAAIGSPLWVNILILLLFQAAVYFSLRGGR